MVFSNKEWMRQYRLRFPWKKHYQWAKSRAKRKGREFSITMNEVEAIWIRDSGSLLERPSIDRIDNSKGYIKGNCRFIELQLNQSLGTRGRKLNETQMEAARKNLALGWEWGKTHKRHNQYTPEHLLARKKPSV